MSLPTTGRRPRNLLVIVSDEHDPRYLGASGATWMHTPNLDALALRGTRFSRAWTPSPICVPARASLATGRFAHECGYWDNAIAYEGRWTSWHHRLVDAGVRTESIGKLHFRRQDDPTGFAAQHEPMHIQDGVGLVWGSVRDPLPQSRGPSPIFDDLGPGLSGYNRYDETIAQAAERWLRERAADPSDRPWALFVGFVAPHMPLVVPQRYLDYYRETAPPLKLRPENGYQRHPWVERMARFWDHDAELRDDQQRALARACYFGLLSYLDERIGQVLSALAATGQDKETTVIYTSDHGDNLGTRGLWNKSTLYRESVGIPMIIAGPDIPEGRVVEANVGLVDIYPTALHACGIERLPEEEDLPGMSLMALADGSREESRRLGFSEYHAVGAESAAFMLCDRRFKYHHYVGYRPELFDLQEDPEELHDLALDPRYRAQCQEFEGRLRSMLDPEAVDAAAKRSQRDLVARFDGRKGAWARGNPGPTPVADKYRMA